jgi:hypothetical protein
MTVGEALANIGCLQYLENSAPVVRTVVREMQHALKLVNVDISAVGDPAELESRPGIMAVGARGLEAFVPEGAGDTDRDYIFFKLSADGCGQLVSSRAHYLFAFACFLVEHMADRPVKDYEAGTFFYPSFRWQRVVYDYFLTQEGRSQRHLNRESYIRELARLGFTHLEVNGLAFPMSLETGPRGEAYPMFYTYCPALDQFVDSDLNRGLYPHYYLSRNLDYLKQNAEWARQYGLVPGLLCFEPRSVPEEFFARYPMLRGARVDHPFRSFKPRYNMTVAHPRVRRHYARMIKRLLSEVPELGYLAVWTNDSGAGFEHTKSLYVGRNGGAYLIREWKDDEEIARTAGENALRFFRVLRDAAREINPAFRVIARLESFYGEHETVWQGLERGIEAETACLFARGWELPYHHPRYPDVRAVNGGSLYQARFDDREKPPMAELKARGSGAHFYLGVGPHTMFEPLLGVPYPRLTFRRLQTLRSAGVEFLAHSGGSLPPELAPFNINHEVVRLFQFRPEMDIAAELKRIAVKWAGKRLAEKLITAWEWTEEAILAFPCITPLYNTHGFTWYRLWLRPLVPDIGAIAPEQRRYYEDFMCTTPHNPNNVDLARDVLFQLTTPGACQQAVERIDRHLWPPLDQAIAVLEGAVEEAFREKGEKNVVRDQWVRLKALHCWFMTQRNVAAWIVGVHGYLNCREDKARARYRRMVRDMMKREIDNSRRLQALTTSGIEFMAVADRGETPLMHGRNFKQLLENRIALMQAHLDDEPYIDPLYMERRSEVEF